MRGGGKSRCEKENDRVKVVERMNKGVEERKTIYHGERRQKKKTRKVDEKGNGSSRDSQGKVQGSSVWHKEDSE